MKNTPTQPLSACCKAKIYRFSNDKGISYLPKCYKCNKSCRIATPDTEDELEKEIEFIVNPQPELSEMLEGNFTKLFKQLQKDLIRKLIRTEKLKVLEQVKLEKKKFDQIQYGWNDTTTKMAGYNEACDENNAIRRRKAGNN